MTRRRQNPVSRKRRGGFSFQHKMMMLLGDFVQAFIGTLKYAVSVIFRNPFAKRPRQGYRDQSVFKRNFQILSVLVVMSSIGYALHQDVPYKVYDFVADSLLVTTQKSGFQVADVVIQGRHYTSPQQVLAAVDLVRNDPLFKYSPEEIRGRVRQISWVRDAKVIRQWPNTVFIKLEERRPLAIWQNQKQHYLVDDEGVVISDKIYAEYQKLPMIVGTDAPKCVSQILSTLVKSPELQNRVTALVFVSGRRWNLQIDGSIDVKLPEKDFEGAIVRLQKVLSQPNVNFKDVKVIDLRNDQRVTLRLNKDSEI